MTVFEERLDELAREIRAVKETQTVHAAALTRIENGVHEILASLGALSNGDAR